MRRKLLISNLDGRKRTLFVLFILQKHNILLLLSVYTNKSKPPFKIQLILSVSEYLRFLCESGNTESERTGVQRVKVAAFNFIFRW